MAVIKPQDDYGTYGSVPTSEPEGPRRVEPRLDVHATPEAFGSQIGGAVEQLGETGEQVAEKASDIAVKFATLATDAKVNDDFANKYSPAAADLRTQYDKLDGQDKVAGIQTYLKGLNNLGSSFTGDDAGTSPAYKEKMGSLISRHIFAETTGANRELVESQKKFAADSNFDMMQANNGLAAQNYNNPALVNDLASRNDAHVIMQHVDAGHDPNDPYSRVAIQDAQNSVKADMASGMINKAVSVGDVNAANKIRADYTPVLPGYKQLQLDNTLHAANMQQTGRVAIDALTNGQPLPEVFGAPASTVQASVANTAHASGLDPNNALAVLRIESSNGQNLGMRGTIGQDKGSAGKPLDEQAKALCDNLKTANQQATTALGRPSEGWEGYTVYQQGAGGGTALLKALQTNPNAKAIDVLEPLYDNPKDAMAAVKNNGGNLTMSVSDFTDHIKQLYNDNFQRANCDFGATQNPGAAITTPHQQAGVTVQPAASPIQALRNFDRTAQTTLSQIQNIPNYETRQRLMESYREKRAVYSDKANSYSADLVNQATQLAVDPKFTSMDQVPAEMAAALATDHPQTLAYMEARAQHNLDYSSGSVTKDMKEYGSGYKDALNGIWNGQITSAAQLHDYVANDKLTIAGYNEMSKQLPDVKSDPVKKAAENKMQANAFAVVRSQITHGVSEEFVKANPELEKTISSADVALFNAIDERKSRNIPAGQYYDPNNKEFIGNDAKVFQMTKANALQAQIQGAKQATKSRTLGDILGEAISSKNDPVKQAKLRQEAIDAGYYDPKAPSVPIAGQ